MALTLIWLSVISFGVYYFSKDSKYKRVFFILSMTLVVLFFTAFIVNKSAYSFNSSLKHAIVFEKEIRVLGEPINNSEELFRLHETKVQVLENLNGWLKIKLEDGQDGWAKEQVLKSFR